MPIRPIDVARLRRLAQRIACPTAAAPEAVVAHLGALQAQDHHGALWSIGLRSAGATRADVERAIVERRIVRTWPMRGTLHFVPAVDARWMLELLTPRIMQSAAGRHRQLELDESAFTRSRTIIERALTEERVLSRSAIFALLEREGVSPAGQRGIHILQQLSMERMLCYGPHTGKQPTFALFDDWIASSRQPERDEALRTLAERYFVSHGPATPRDFVGWTGLTVADATRAVTLARPALEPVMVGDVEHWMSGEVAAVDRDGPPAHLLPGFDELLLGYKDRSASLAPRHAEQVVPGANGMFRATLLFEAQVRGTWKRSPRGKTVVLDASPFGRLKADQKRAFDRAAARYAEFLGAPVTIRWTK